jgi:DNA invertase Pin-like site-specific DNA recombinase
MEMGYNIQTQPKVVKVIKRTTEDFQRILNESFVDNRIPVAAYARVSTNHLEQEDSLERQTAHYTEKITGNPDWKFAGIYADPGITGTRADKRPEFQRLIADCRYGKVKRVLVKSISRFARNTVDALNYIRELKELGIGIFFENEQIDTLSTGGEVLITVLAAMAEQESRNMSTNIKWAFRKKFQDGEIMLNYKFFLGYTRDENKNLVIVPEEAKVVRRIYREFLSGKSLNDIAKGLTADGIATPAHKKQWRVTTVQGILTNEKYYGAAFLGKTCKMDVLSKKRIDSDEIYYVENSHPAIIDKATWDIAQAEMKKRQEYRTGTKTCNGKYSSKYPFSKRLTCGECGLPLRRHAQTIKRVYTRTWVCPTHKLKGYDYCKQKYVTEEAVERAFVKALKELIGDIGDIKKILKGNIIESLDDSIPERLERVQIETEDLQTKMIELTRAKRSGIIDYDECNRKGMELAEKIRELNNERAELESRSADVLVAKNRITEILKTLEEITPTEKFDGEMFLKLVDEVIIKDGTATFMFKVGINKKIKL